MDRSDHRADAGVYSIWNGDIGGGFRKGAMDVGFGAGAGPGVKAFGSDESHDLALGYGHFGWICTNVLKQALWPSGNLELWGEIFGGAQYSPKDRYTTGLTIGPRYYFVTGSRWVPFLDGGVGLSATDIGLPDLSTTFEFNVQAGLGTFYFCSKNLAIGLQSRWFHLSNAGIEEPNKGGNTIIFLLGASRYF
ncbi:MAG: acyloxyacyl hydrolase [Desulfobacteraceae bacterium]|nr:acyloxyacyl hydrolase [Desulfobacteraceae bacterium]